MSAGKSEVVRWDYDEVAFKQMVNAPDGDYVLHSDYAALESLLLDARAEVERLREEVALLTHKVITCGVAASHPDSLLSTTGAYGNKWDSPQAQQVRELRQRAERAERAEALAVERLELLSDCREPVEWAEETAYGEYSDNERSDRYEAIKHRIDAAIRVVCTTCDGNGIIGGPSFREPDEGGVPCPDCTAIDAVGGRGDAGGERGK